jgi:hypothetical protein
MGRINVTSRIFAGALVPNGCIIIITLMVIITLTIVINVGHLKKLFTLLDLCVSSLRRGHANLLCIVPILTDDPRRESKQPGWPKYTPYPFCPKLYESLIR